MGYIEQHKDVNEMRCWDHHWGNWEWHDMLNSGYGDEQHGVARRALEWYVQTCADSDTAASLATDLIFIQKVETTSRSSSVQTLSARERPPTVVATENAVIRLAASWLLWTKGWGGDQLPWWRSNHLKVPLSPLIKIHSTLEKHIKCHWNDPLSGH